MPVEIVDCQEAMRALRDEFYGIQKLVLENFPSYSFGFEITTDIAAQTNNCSLFGSNPNFLSPDPRKNPYASIHCRPHTSDKNNGKNSSRSMLITIFPCIHGDAYERTKRFANEYDSAYSIPIRVDDYSGRSNK